MASTRLTEPIESAPFAENTANHFLARHATKPERLTERGSTVLHVLILATATASTVWGQIAWLPPWLAPRVQGIAVASLADVLATLTAVFGAILLGRSRRRFPVPRPLLFAGLLVVGVAVAGTLWAGNPLLAGATALHLLVLLVLFVVVAYSRVPTEQVCLALVAGLVVQLPLETVQVITQSTFHAGSLLAWKTDLSPRMSGASVLLRLDGTRWLRPYGPFFHPNILGGYLALELTLLLGLFIGGRGRNWSARKRILFGVGCGLVVGGLVVTGSRGAWFGASAGIVALLFGSHLARLPVDEQRERGVWSQAMVAVAALTTLLYVAAMRPPLLERFAPMSNSLERRSVELRLQELVVGSALVARHPLLGVGAGGGQAAAGSYLDGAFAPEPVHNVPLLMTVEMGPLAFVAWVVAATYIVVATLGSRTRWTVVFFAGLTVTAVAGLTDHYWWSDSSARDTVVVLAGSWAAQLRYRTTEVVL